jgi:hypothetical protein
LSRCAEDLTRPRDVAPDTIMKTLFTAEAISKGGRSGTIQIEYSKALRGDTSVKLVVD